MSIIKYCLASFSRSGVFEFVDGFEIFDPFKNNRIDSSQLEDCADIEENIELMDDVIDKSLKFYFSQDNFDSIKN